MDDTDPEFTDGGSLMALHIQVFLSGRDGVVTGGVQEASADRGAGDSVETKCRYLMVGATVVSGACCKEAQPPAIFTSGGVTKYATKPG